MDRIKKDYPWLKNEDPYEWAILAGWNKLINQLLEACNVEMIKHPSVILTIIQVKEKLGGLRFYYSLSEGAPDELFKALRFCIDAAEELAWNTCEQCGDPGQLRRKGSWLLVCCGQHAPKGSKLAF